MNYRILITIIYLNFIVINSFSQNRTVVIVDSKDKTTVPYATIKLLNKNAWYFSDKNGVLSIPNYESDSLLVEYSGYFSCRLIIGKITDTIFLTRRLYELPTVLVKSFKTKHTVGRFKYKKINTIFLSESTEYALKIDLSEIKGNYKIKQLFLPLGFNNKTFSSCTLKLHLYKEGENGKPEQDILNRPIILQQNYLLNKDFFIDVSEQNLFLSEKSLFVGIECIIDKTVALGESKSAEKNEFKQQIKDSPITLFISNEKQFFNDSYDHTFFRLLNSKVYEWYGGNSKSKEPINFSAGLIILSNQ